MGLGVYVDSGLWYYIYIYKFMPTICSRSEYKLYSDKNL